MGGLTESERYAFDVHGYLVRRHALSAAEVADLNAAVDALRLPLPADTIQSQRFSGHLASSPAFVALLDHPAVFAVLVELCGTTLRLDHAYGIVMAAGTSGLGLHGGATPFDPAQFYVVNDGRISCGLVAVQWALVDHRPGDGGFCCIPGSHKGSFRLPDPPPPGLAVEVSLAAGDVVVFTEALVHGTLTWRGERDRRTLLYKYSPGSSSWGKDETLPPELAPMLSGRQRLLFEPPYVAYRRPVT
jgi:ectoine hydroxylase-related dioxygenase (phytanoyl-CoA dioxygenase family)